MALNSCNKQAKERLIDNTAVGLPHDGDATLSDKGHDKLRALATTYHNQICSMRPADCQYQDCQNKGQQ